MTTSAADTPPLLEAIELQTHSSPHWSVIWLHGLGAHGSDFVGAIPALNLPDEHAVRFIFPHAPAIPVTCNGGYVMPAWYDILSLDDTGRSIDEHGLLNGRSAVRRLIERENARGIDSRHIILAGFSQGGALAYYTALTHPEPLAGLIALSTYIPSERLIRAELSPANRNLPLFVAHGTLDDIVPMSLAHSARDTLNQCGLKPEWHEYEDLPHAVNLNELRDIGAWLGHHFIATRAKR